LSPLYNVTINYINADGNIDEIKYYDIAEDSVWRMVTRAKGALEPLFDFTIISILVEFPPESTKQQS